MYSLWLDLSVCPKNFDLVTLTFDLLLKKPYLGYNFWIKTDRAFLFLIYIPRGKPFCRHQNFDSLTLALRFDLILRKWKCFMITIISSQVYKSLGRVVFLLFNRHSLLNICTWDLAPVFVVTRPLFGTKIESLKVQFWDMAPSRANGTNSGLDQ